MEKQAKQAKQDKKVQATLNIVEREILSLLRQARTSQKGISRLANIREDTFQGRNKFIDAIRLYAGLCRMLPMPEASLADMDPEETPLDFGDSAVPMQAFGNVARDNNMQLVQTFLAMGERYLKLQEEKMGKVFAEPEEAPEEEEKK